LTLNLEKGEADVSRRATGGWRATVGTLKDASIEFEMVWDTADDDFNAIRDSFLTGAKIDTAVLDGPATGAGSSGNQGLRADMEVMKFSRSEPLEEAIKVSVTIKPTFSNNPPTWMTVP
jgi:hypothetical protein